MTLWEEHQVHAINRNKLNSTKFHQIFTSCRSLWLLNTLYISFESSMCSCLVCWRVGRRQGIGAIPMIVVCLSWKQTCVWPCDDCDLLHATIQMVRFHFTVWNPLTPRWNLENIWLPVFMALFNTVVDFFRKRIAVSHYLTCSPPLPAISSMWSMMSSGLSSSMGGLPARV